MQWSDVGDWLKKNAGTGAALVGSLLTGNVPGAVAAGAALVSSATGTSDPKQALEALQSDPVVVLKLRELAVQEEASIREHIRAIEEMRLKDQQAKHAETQKTIREGDEAQDAYVRHTRPRMARQSWYGTIAYIALAEGAAAFSHGSGASLELAALVLSPAWAYLGLRTADGVFGKRGK